jgi:hypothetical protein
VRWAEIASLLIEEDGSSQFAGEALPYLTDKQGNVGKRKRHDDANKRSSQRKNKDAAPKTSESRGKAHTAH